MEQGNDTYITEARLTVVPRRPTDRFREISRSDSSDHTVGDQIFTEMVYTII